jgi:hypothetical protein
MPPLEMAGVFTDVVTTAVNVMLPPNTTLVLSTDKVIDVSFTNVNVALVVEELA